MATNAPERAAPVPVPLYRTIADAIIRDIRRGRHLEGERLPASRDLARALEVNRATVHQALQLLKREGWVETNKGGGTRVARRSSAGPVLGPAPAWDRIASSLLTRILAEPPAVEPVVVPYDLSRLAPDERDFPAAAFAALLADVARDGSLLAYGSPFGYRPLRETLAQRLVKRGIPADPDALLIVNGAQQGLDLITRALVDPGPGRRRDAVVCGGAFALPGAPGAARGCAAGRRRSRAGRVRARAPRKTEVRLHDSGFSEPHRPSFFSFPPRGDRRARGRV